MFIMKIPEVRGKRKIRDLKICQLYLEGASQEEIAMRFNLNQSTIARILYRNREALTLDKNYEKIKRINWYKRQLREKTASKKDGADIQEAIRNEIEGLEVHHTGIPVNNNITYVITNDPKRVGRNIRGVFDSENRSCLNDTEPQV